MKGVVIASAAFVAGVYTGLFVAASTAAAAGCPAAGAKKAAEGGKGARSTVNGLGGLLGTLGSVQQRTVRREPGGTS